MIAREAVLNDPEIVQLLRTRFVCIGVDNVDHPNMTAAEKDWLKDKGGKACTQGMSVFTADGKVLAMGGGFEAGPVKRMLQNALSKYEPPPADAGGSPPIPPRDETDAGIRRPPEGALVCYVTWKVLGECRPESSSTTGNGRYDKTFHDALGVDRFWIRKDEAEALARGEFPTSLKRRIVPHLGYAFAGKVTSLDLLIRDGRLTGSFQSDTGETGQLLGVIETKAGKVTRFDLVVKGVGERVSDFGFAAGLTVIPKGEKVPVGLLFSLADPGDDLSKVPPHRAKDQAYLR